VARQPREFHSRLAPLTHGHNICHSAWQNVQEPCQTNLETSWSCITLWTNLEQLLQRTWSILQVRQQSVRINQLFAKLSFSLAGECVIQIEAQVDRVLDLQAQPLLLVTEPAARVHHLLQCAAPAEANRDNLRAPLVARGVEPKEATQQLSNRPGGRFAEPEPGLHGLGGVREVQRENLLPAAASAAAPRWAAADGGAVAAGGAVSARRREAVQRGQAVDNLEIIDHHQCPSIGGQVSRPWLRRTHTMQLRPSFHDHGNHRQRGVELCILPDQTGVVEREDIAEGHVALKLGVRARCQSNQGHTTAKHNLFHLEGQ